MPFAPASHSPYTWDNSPATDTPLDSAHLQASEQDLITYIQQVATALDSYLENLCLNGPTIVAPILSGLTSVTGGQFAISTAGFGLSVKEGANAKQGTAVFPGSGTPNSVVVSCTAVTASSRIFLTTQVPGGTVGSPYIYSVAAGVQFTIASTSTSDTSTVAYEIFEPA